MPPKSNPLATPPDRGFTLLHRRTLLLGLAAALPTAAPAHAAGGQGAVLIMNSGAASLSVLDIATRTELRRIPVLREPHHWTLTPDKRDLLLGDVGANELLILDPASFAIRRRVTMSDPYQLGFSPDGKFLVVAAIARKQIDVYEPGSYRLIQRFTIRSMPSHLDFAPDSSMVFVTLQGTDRVVAIDLRAMAVKWNMECGRAPAGVLFHNNRVLVGNMGSDDVTVMDASDGRTLRRIRTGRGAHTLFRAPDGKTIWVNNRLDQDSVVVLDAATLNPIRSYRLPGGPDDLEFAPDGRVWFTMRFIHKVAVLDPATGSFTTTDVGRSPHGIFLNPKGVATG